MLDLSLLLLDHGRRLGAEIGHSCLVDNCSTLVVGAIRGGRCLDGDSRGTLPTENEAVSELKPSVQQTHKDTTYSLLVFPPSRDWLRVIWSETVLRVVYVL